MLNFYRDRVLNGDLEVDRVFESESVVAYRHTHPSYPEHIVVLPKEEIDDFLCLDPTSTLATELASALQSVAAKVITEHGKCRVITNLGDYQDTKHLHWHVVSGDRLNDAGTESR